MEKLFNKFTWISNAILVLNPVAWDDLLEIDPVAMESKDQSVDQLVTYYKNGPDKSISN